MVSAIRRLPLCLAGVVALAGCNPPSSSDAAPPPRLAVSVKLPALDGGVPATPGPSVWVGPDGIAVGADLDGTKAETVTNLVGGYRTDGGAGVIAPLETELKARRGAAPGLAVFADASVPVETLGWVLATASVAGFTDLQLAVGGIDAPRVVPIALPREGIVDPAAGFDWGYPADMELWWDRGSLLVRAVPRGTSLAPAPLPEAGKDAPVPGPVPVDLGERVCSLPAAAGRPDVATVSGTLVALCGMPAQSYRLRLIPKPASSVESLAAVLVGAAGVDACKVEPILLPASGSAVPECRRPKPVDELPEHMKPPPPPMPMPKPEPAVVGGGELVGIFGALEDSDDAELDSLFGDAEGGAELDAILGGDEGSGEGLGGVGVITDPE